MHDTLALIAFAFLCWGAIGLFIPKITFNSRAVAIFIASIFFLVVTIAVDEDEKSGGAVLAIIYTLWALLVFIILMVRVAIMGMGISRGKIPKKDGWVEKLALKIWKTSNNTDESRVTNNNPFVAPSPPANDVNLFSDVEKNANDEMPKNRWRGYVALFVISLIMIFLFVGFVLLLGFVGFFAFCVIMAVVSQLFTIKAEYTDTKTGEVTIANVGIVQLLDDFLRNPSIKFENAAAKRRQQSTENLHFRKSRSRQYVPTKKATISQRASARKNPYIDYGEGDEYHDIQNDNRWFEGERGQGATFEYADHYGEVTDREVRNWVSNGPYIKAFCLLRRENRSFRKDRISNWIED